MAEENATRTILDRYLQDCSERYAAGSLRLWLCRLLRPTLGKKLFLLFAALAATAIGNWLAVETALSQQRGMAALVNVTGSLRWLSQRIQLGTARIERGLARERAPVDADLTRLEEVLRALESGGSAQGIAVAALPAGFETDIAVARRAGEALCRHARLALAGLEAGREVRQELDAMYAAGGTLLATADAIAAALTLGAAAAEARLMDILLRLGLLDLALLVAALLVLRLRVVLPLRRLASASRRFAAGRREVRSGFRSLDEIGQLSLAFDKMADTIAGDLRALAENAAELERRQQALAKFSLAIEQAPVSVIIADAQTRIEYVNPKFSEISGYAAQEVIGRQPSLLASGATPREVYAGMWEQLRAGRPWQGELLNRRKNGETFWEDTRIAPLMDAGGRITHYVAVKEDVTPRKRAEEELRRLNAELERRVAERTRRLEESNRELEAFSYSVSHDLRAPLRAINGFASLMAENCAGCAKTESLAFMARIQRASLRMGNLIDDILELSRLARSPIKVERLDLSAMARAILDDLAAAGPPRNVIVEVEPGLLAEGDATLLQAALENLLGNAWKFTARRDPARIEFGVIEACPAAGPPQGGAANDRERSEPSSPPCRGRGTGGRCFFVRDNGAGFDMKYAGKLFGAFQRLHGAQEFEGNGIGLAMVRRIVGLHGGRIWAEAAPGEGATFYFTLGAAASTSDERP